MRTKEIQQSVWPEFFDTFSRKHQGTLIGMEILGPEIGAQLQEDGLSLEGITAETDEVSTQTIMIMVGAKADHHITHSIRHPTQVSLEQNDEGVDIALTIQGDRSTAVLRFEWPGSPEGS